ncbi:hypothetical protein BDN67DRAFT_1011592 [Paxillus ammoniavirescens]|nr:hypothetical protein BDN67DRAFT_1011592 [Paxillus ammoniavirescens]
MSPGSSGPFFQSSFYVGDTFNAIPYEVELVLYPQTIDAVHKRRKCGLCILVGPEGRVHTLTHKSPRGTHVTLGSTASILLQLMSGGYWRVDSKPTIESRTSSLRRSTAPGLFGAVIGVPGVTLASFPAFSSGMQRISALHSSRSQLA